MRIATTLFAAALALTTSASTATAEHRAKPLARVDQLALRLEHQAESTRRLIQTHYVRHGEYDRLVASAAEIAQRAGHIHADAHDTHGGVRDMRHIRRELDHAENLLHDMRRIVRRMKRDVEFESHRFEPHRYGYSRPQLGVSFGHGFRISLVGHDVPSYGRHHRHGHVSSGQQRTLNLLSARLKNMDRLVHELDELTWHMPRH